MKKNILLSFAFLLLNVMAFAQTTNRVIPSVDVKKLDGSSFNTDKIQNDGKPMIIDFWATWCSPCKAELNAIAEDYADWQAETGVKLVAVSIDDARNVDKVAPYVNGKGWDYEVLLDVNGDFKRAMNVNMIPHTFLLNGNGEIVWQHTSFSEGSELELIEMVRKLNRGESVDTH